MKLLSFFVLICALLFLLYMSYNLPTETTALPDKPQLTYQGASFDGLPAWQQDATAEALKAFQKSCARIVKKDPTLSFSKNKKLGTYGQWQGACAEALTLNEPDDAAARNFFESRFNLWKIVTHDESGGLFTGYYEPLLHGSLNRTDIYGTPLLKRPEDLISVDLGMFREELKGKRIAGRIRDGALVPYNTRAEIIAADPAEEDVLVWVDDPVDAFFLQIQGSGRVTLEDGGEMQLGYAAQNGHVYFAIGKALIERGALTKENVSLQTIRAWLAANPDQRDEIMNLNPSYVYFQAQERDGPLGAEGVVLTAGRSLAVDPLFTGYGAPLWLEAGPPLQNEPPVNRLMIAQDTGGAIIGPVRGDVFWGFGAQAELYAGHMKSRGEMWLLAPKELDLSVTALP